MAQTRPIGEQEGAISQAKAIKKDIMNQILNSRTTLLNYDSLPTSIRKMLIGESTINNPSTLSALPFFNVMVIIIRKYLHASWCIPKGTKDTEIIENMLMIPLKDLFKISLKMDGESETQINKINKIIDDNIKSIFRDLLKKENVVNYCVALLQKAADRLNATLDNLDSNQNQKDKMSGIFYQIYRDVKLGYLRIGLRESEIDINNEDKIEFFESLMGKDKDKTITTQQLMGNNVADNTFFIICNRYNPITKNIASMNLTIWGLSLLLLMAILYYKHQSTKKIDIVDVIFLGILSGMIALKFITVKKENEKKKKSLQQQEKYLTLVNDFVSLNIIELVKNSIENKSIENKRKRKFKHKKSSVNDNMFHYGAPVSYTENSIFSQTLTSKEENGKEKDKVDAKEKCNRKLDKLNEMEKHVKDSINQNFPVANSGTVEPTWFNGMVSSKELEDFSQFKPIRKTNTEDYFLLLPGVDSSQDNLFENISDIVYNDTLKPLKTSENTIFQCELNGKTYNIEVQWELKPNNKTKDRILVGRICADEGNKSNLYIGFKYIKNGFHTDSKLANVLAGLRSTKIDLNSIPCKKQKQMSLLPSPGHTPYISRGK